MKQGKHKVKPFLITAVCVCVWVWVYLCLGESVCVCVSVREHCATSVCLYISGPHLPNTPVVA